MDAREKREGYWETPEGEGRLRHACSELAEITDYLVREDEFAYRVDKRREVAPRGSATDRIVAPMMVERWYLDDCGRDPELAVASFWLVREALPPEDPKTPKRVEALALLHRSLTAGPEGGARGVNRAQGGS